MKKVIKLAVLFLFAVFSLTACKYAGDNLKKDVSLKDNNEGHLITKVPSDFDNKFGYEVAVSIVSGDSVSETQKVFISQKTWQRLPEPNDTTTVIIEYVQNIEYGNGNYAFFSFWDFQFNVCTGYRIINPKEITKVLPKGTQHGF